MLATLAFRGHRGDSTKSKRTDSKRGWEGNYSPNLTYASRGRNEMLGQWERAKSQKVPDGFQESSVIQDAKKSKGWSSLHKVGIEVTGKIVLRKISILVKIFKNFRTDRF